jgi:hypothetical protein
MREIGLRTRLDDHQNNLNRVLWIACGDIRRSCSSEPPTRPLTG